MKKSNVLKLIILFLVINNSIKAPDAPFDAPAVKIAIDTFKAKIAAFDSSPLLAKIKGLQDLIANADSSTASVAAVAGAKVKISEAQALLARIPTQADIILLETAYASYLQATEISTLIANASSAQDILITKLNPIDAQILAIKTAQEPFRSSLSGVPLPSFLK